MYHTTTSLFDEDFETEAYEEIQEHFEKFLNANRLYRKIEPRFVYKKEIAINIVNKINEKQPKHLLTYHELIDYKGCYVIYFTEILEDCLHKL